MSSKYYRISPEGRKTALIARQTPVPASASAYLESLLAGDGRAAAKAVDAAMLAGLGVAEIAASVFLPALRHVGDLWHEGKASIAVEHLATQLTYGQQDRVRSAVRPKARLGLTAVVCSVEGDNHAFGARVVSDILYTEGWTSLFLGPDMPAAAIAGFAQERAAALVVLSATLPEHLEALGRSVSALRALSPRPKVLSGGPALAALASRDAHTYGDRVLLDITRTAEAARELVGVGSTVSLEPLLSAIGERVSEVRKQRGWSQQQLADAAGLDRTYVSALERGKQNISLGVLVRVAGALGVPLEVLLGLGEEGGS